MISNTGFRLFCRGSFLKSSLLINKNATISRKYLTAAYQCNEAFKQRLNEDLVKEINSNFFYVEMMQAKGRQSKVFAIDVDLYIQSLTTEDNSFSPEDIEELLQVLRNSPESVNTLPSTWHTTLRLLLEKEHHDLIFQLLSQPQLYGIYLDKHSAHLLMNQYLISKDYTRAARTAFHLMLMEDYGTPLTHMMSTLSCLQWVFNQETNTPWTDYVVKPEEPEEEVKRRFDYYPNPYFDDHFHLTEAAKCVGKTLAWGAEANLSGDIKFNCQLLGYSLWGKWRKLQTIIGGLDKEGVKLSASVIETVKGTIEEKCADETIKSKLTELLEGVKTDSEYDVLVSVEGKLKDLVPKLEGETVKEQELFYSEAAQRRIDVMEELKKEEYKQQMLREIKEKKKDLIAEEQELTMFHNEKKIDLVLEQRGQYKHPFPRERPWRYSRIRKTRQNEEYVPPEMNKRGSWKDI